MSIPRLALASALLVGGALLNPTGCSDESVMRPGGDGSSLADAASGQDAGLSDMTVTADGAADLPNSDASTDIGPEITVVPGNQTPYALGDLTIAPKRVPNWTTVGVEGGIPDTAGWPRVNALDHGATPGNASDDDAAAINRAITFAAENHPRAVVFLPAGDYRIVQPNRIELASNVVLQGAGPEMTTIHSVMGSQASSGIEFAGSSRGEEIAVVGGLTEGSGELTLAGAPAFSVGDFVLVRQNDDDRIASEATHARGIGQVVKVTAIAERRITIEPHLRVHLNPDAQPRVAHHDFIVNSGVEDLAIDFAPVANVPLYRGSTISFAYAVNSWTRNIKAEDTYHVFVKMNYSARLTVADSYFEGMQKPDYTNAYTIDFGALTSDCLATNNILKDVWVTAIFSHSCNGNVYSYNFHTDIRQDHGIIHHGAYPFENLVEGNDAYRITNDRWWGQQGPRLTFFRNRAAEIRTSRNGACQNHGNIVATQANFLLNTANYYLSFPWCSYPDGCAAFDDFNTEMWVEKNRYQTAFKALDQPGPTNTFVDNVVGADVAAQWSGLSFPASLYLRRRPDFWCSELPWPAIGSDVDNDAALHTLPAERRYRGLPCSH